MALKKLTKEELELYSYIDIAKMILEEEKKPLNTPSIFKKICDLLEMSDEDYENKISDFYTSLTTDKSFILLEDGTWDLRDNHPSEVVLEEEDDDIDEEEPIEEDEEDEEEIIEDSYDDVDDEEDMDEEELTIISEEELEED